MSRPGGTGLRPVFRATGSGSAKSARACAIDPRARTSVLGRLWRAFKAARTARSLTLGVLCAAPALAGQLPPDYGFQWCAVGDLGNRPVSTQENLNVPTPRPLGSVNYQYRMARTEVTNADWLVFVKAYIPHYYTDHPYGTLDHGLLGYDIDFGFGDLTNPNIYHLTGNPNAPASMNWVYAARYVNWLCNGKRSDRAAFENGAYDTSTFTYNPDGTGNFQLAHNPGAQFWIPTIDEWVKAVYWDPNKSNPDGSLGGYWRYPNRTNQPVPAGPPGSGGQSNWGGHGPIEVGSYPLVTTPWGLLDASGGASEFTESCVNSLRNDGRIIMGSAYDFRHGIPSSSFDRIDSALGLGDGVLTGGPSAGLRLASIVPSPGGVVALGLPLSLSLVRRRRREESDPSRGGVRRAGRGRFVRCGDRR